MRLAGRVIAITVAEVGEQHARELDRADAGEFNDPDPGQWPAHRRTSEVSAISAHLYI